MSPSVWGDLETDAYDILSRSVVPSIPKMKERFQATSEITLARQLKAMLETSAEVLICLIRAFDHYERKNRSCLAQH
jgi:hypothetical protein